MFAYLYYKEKGHAEMEISDESIDTKIGSSFSCGQTLYSETPKHSQLLLGLSGTIESLSTPEKSILKEYGCESFSTIPSLYPKKTLEVRPTRVFNKGDKDEEFFDEIKKEMVWALQVGRPCLVVFLDQDALSWFKSQLQRKKITAIKGFVAPQELSYAVQSKHKDIIIAKATRPKVATLMTREFGRGTDFVCHSTEVINAGGTHVIQTFLADSQAEEIQIKGRTCRQDNPGSYRKVLLRVPAEDAPVNPKSGSDDDELDSGGHLCGQKSFSWTDKEHSGVEDGAWDEFLAKKRADVAIERFDSMQTRLSQYREGHEATLEMAKALQSRDGGVRIAELANQLPALFF
jgi:hypothetical protein